MDTRTRWIIGILLALVIGLGVALLIVAADDDSNDVGSTRTREKPATATLSEPTTTTAPTTSTTAPTGGTSVPGSTTAPNGQGGL